ncbi:hypothetical protein CEXT_283831 [Caerostris extrusa]|uniref:Uncharacterized protein n=1 Tax=Caerostris extrusa TaxID=172846 RepID=A0AAV4NNQ8_CAEEX|nr:hypothetical protein CEXT_283831 [Caerostris extrusa]
MPVSGFEPGACGPKDQRKVLGNRYLLQDWQETVRCQWRAHEDNAAAKGSQLHNPHCTTDKRTGVLLKSSDQKYFRGTVTDSSSSNTTKTQPSKDKSESMQNIQQPAPVTLQSTFSRPLPDAKISLPKDKS